MTTFQTTPSLVLLTLAISLLLTNGAVTEAAKVATVDAPSPAPPPPINLTDILKNGTRYNTFMRLLKDTEVASEVTSLIDGDRNADGLTVLAPTDGAFGGLRPGTLNRLGAQDQAELVLFHLLPKFYSIVTFETTSNPVRTQASGERGVCTVNVTATSGVSGSQVNVSSGLMETTLGDALYSEFPLAVYSVDKVLLPPDLFGPNAKKRAAEAPAATRKHGKHGSSSTVADSPSEEADDTANSSGAGRKPAASVVAFGGIVLAAVLGSWLY